MSNKTVSPLKGRARPQEVKDRIAATRKATWATQKAELETLRRIAAAHYATPSVSV